MISAKMVNEDITLTVEWIGRDATPIELTKTGYTASGVSTDGSCCNKNCISSKVRID